MKEDDSDLDQFNSVETMLYCTNMRQRLIDDLEELECFLRQRQSELGSKDQSLFNVYQDANIAKSKSQDFVKLRSECDDQGCIQRNLKVIAKVLSTLQDERFIQTMQIRQKP